MFRSIVIAAAVIATATPAFANADPARPADTATTKVAVSPNTRYCYRVEMTGSHLRRKICHTRAEWLARGTDPLETPRGR